MQSKLPFYKLREGPVCLGCGLVALTIYARLVDGITCSHVCNDKVIENLRKQREERKKE